MQTYSFEDLVGDKEVFFSKFFNKRPLLRRGALAGSVGDLISAGQLDDLIASQAVSPAYVRVAKDGKGVPHKAYTRTVTAPGGPLSDVVVPKQVYELFRAGGTITWNYVHHFVPSVRRLLEGVTDTLSCRGEVVTFLTPARKDGYAPHHDPVDVFVVQVEGTKAWKVWETPEVRRSGDKASYTLEQLGAPVLEATLTPGDVLYLPYNTPHAAAAQDEVSLHLSVTVEPRRWRDLLCETAQDLVQDDAFEETPYLGNGHEPAALTGLAEKLRLLQEKLATLDPATEAARLVSAGRARTGSTAPREFERLSAADGLTRQSPLRRTSVPVVFTASEDGKTGLLVNGHRLAVPNAVAQALRQMQGGGQIAAGDIFPGVPVNRSLRAAQGLARLGVLETADETRS